MTKRTWITAAELIAKLEQGPVWVEKRRQREEKRRLEEEESARTSIYTVITDRARNLIPAFPGSFRRLELKKGMGRCR